MTAVLEQPHAPRPKKWSKEEYLDLVERGVFRGQRVILFRGDIIEMPPQGHPHQYAIMKLVRYLTDTFRPPYEVRIQLPFITPGSTVPEPDAAVCKEADIDHMPSPVHAELIVEVAYSSLREDRALAEEYAAAKVPEYWIVDIDRRCIEVYRNPVEDRAARLGYRYADVRVYKLGESVSPASRPEAEIPVGFFFPGE